MFSGSIVALITPLRFDGEVDYVGLKKLVNFHVESGTDGIVSVGTTGESATLSIEEHVKVVERTVEYAQGRIPIIAGAGANATHEALTFARLMNNTGIAACLSVTPYYNKPTQEGLYLHYKAISEETDTPQILYNVPGRTGVDLQPETVGRLSKINTIVGIKDATGDVSRVRKHRELCGDDFVLLSGDDSTGFESIKLGGNGVISVTNNLAAADMAQMVHLALAGRFDEANVINERLMGLHRKLFIESSPIPVKWAAEKMGLIESGVLRLPMTTLSGSAIPAVQQAMKDAGLI